MMDRQQAVADVVRADPDVASVSSFIGADGTNPTLNSGRLSITLKPRDERDADAQRDHRPPGARAAPRSTASPSTCRPVQDLQIESRVSRTQYQYTLEDADPAELADLGAARARPRCSSCPSCADVASDQQEGGAPADAGHRSRHAPSRLGITPQAIDDTLYDAFGQRQVSTIFTQLNLYRVILEVAPAVPAETRTRSTRSTCAAPSGEAVPLVGVRALRARPRRRCRSRTRASSRR